MNEKENAQNIKRRQSNNAAVQSQWSRTDAKILSERSRAVPDAMPKIKAPAAMRRDGMISISPFVTLRYNRTDAAA